MRIIYGYDEEIYKRICWAAGKGQIREDYQLIRKVIRDKNAEFYFARIDEIACIWGRFNKAMPTMRIYFLAVRKDYAGKGVGGALLLRALQDAARHGVKTVYTISGPGKTFYEQFGFIAKRRDERGYYLEVELERTNISKP